MSSIGNLRQKLNSQLFDVWELGAPKTPKLARAREFNVNLVQESLTLREQRALDWHFLRMKIWGVAIPAFFLASFKPVLLFLA